MRFKLGVKTDPIHYRYSYEWLFDLLAEENISHIQLGTYFEVYQLPLDYFHELREKANARGLTFTSVFTTHRELGGYFNPDPRFTEIAQASFKKLIDVAAAVGSPHCGSNPGAVFRDRSEDKAAGIERYLEGMKSLMHHAHEVGLKVLNMEYMSCSFEPPSALEEIEYMVGTLLEYHEKHKEQTVPVYACADISHGLLDEDHRVLWNNIELFDRALHLTSEFHFKNTDSHYSSTFGFTDPDMSRGIIDLHQILELIEAAADRIPVDPFFGYLELPGPKLGRDYSDPLLRNELTESLKKIKEVFIESEKEA